MPRMRSILLFLPVLVLSVTTVACSADGSDEVSTVTITHGPVTPTATIPGSQDGIGTLRTFHAPVEANGGVVGYFDSTMTTTGVDLAAGTETRITTIVVTLNDGADQLILEGAATYPAAGSTVQPATTVTRPIIGGSGVYVGARGWVESTRFADDTWAHVFHFVG